MEDVKSLLEQQIAYYQARASEYDEWFLRKGRYDHGAGQNQLWFEEVKEVRDALDKFQPCGRVLELACGTGLWTEQLLHYACHVTAIDAANEALELNRARVDSSKVSYLQADIFTWQPEERYDIIFFGFWLSHVPSRYFEPFWKMIGSGLKPDGRIFFVDSKYETTSTARDHHLGDIQDNTVTRKLNDGREYQIVKIFYEREQLEKRLAGMGWSVAVKETPRYFLFGYGSAG